VPLASGKQGQDRHCTHLLLLLLNINIQDSHHSNQNEVPKGFGTTEKARVLWLCPLPFALSINYALLEMNY